MSEYLSKKAVLDAIETEQLRLMGEHQSVTGYHKRYVTGKYDVLNWVKHQILSGAFDVATDADVAEIEKALAEERAAHNAHATELCLQDQEIKRLHAEIERLRSELCTLKEAYDDAEMRADDAIAERDDAQKCLDRALEALEDIYHHSGKFGFVTLFEKSRQAIQSIRGGGTDEAHRSTE